MKISYKAVYHLLDQHYVRRSLNSIIKDDIPKIVFEASKVFAHKIEDYRFLDVMIKKRNDLDKKYAIFIDHDDLPIILEKNRPFSITGFANLCAHSQINDKLFIDVVEAQADNHADIDTENVKEQFIIDLKLIREAMKKIKKHQRNK